MWHKREKQRGRLLGWDMQWKKQKELLKRQRVQVDDCTIAHKVTKRSSRGWHPWGADGQAGKHKQKAKVQWEGWRTVFINSISYTKTQPKAKQNGSDDTGENVWYVGGDSVPVMLRKCIATDTCLEVGAVTPLGIWAAWGKCFTFSRTARGRQDMNLLGPPLLPQNNPCQE